MRIDAALAAIVPQLSRERIKALIADGRVSLDGKVVRRPSITLSSDMHFAIELPPLRPLQTKAEDIALDIVFEDNHLLVVDKPAGLVVHPAAGHGDGTLVNALLHHCAGQLSGIGGTERPGIVHRIDKDTSGLMVVAKSDAAHIGLSKQFADHSIERRYVAIVRDIPRPRSGTVTGAIGRSGTNRKKMAIVEEGRGKHAVTHFTTLEALDNAALIECRLETGRTHQIRVHMTSIGHPLLGDPVYGRVGKSFHFPLESIGFRRQALHAQRLGFIHPVTGEKYDYFSPIPPDMKELVARLRV